MKAKNQMKIFIKVKTLIIKVLVLKIFMLFYKIVKKN